MSPRVTPAVQAGCSGWNRTTFNPLKTVYPYRSRLSRILQHHHNDFPGIVRLVQ